MHCGNEFKLADSTPLAGQQGLRLCPKCGKPTPLTSRRPKP
jgi:hypothetical protein